MIQLSFTWTSILFLSCCVLCGFEKQIILGSIPQLHTPWASQDTGHTSMNLVGKSRSEIQTREKQQTTGDLPQVQAKDKVLKFRFLEFCDNATNNSNVTVPIKSATHDNNNNDELICGETSSKCENSLNSLKSLGLRFDSSLLWLQIKIKTRIH